MAAVEVSSQLIRKLLFAAAAMGADTTALIARLNIPQEPLFDLEARLPAELGRRVWDAVEEATGNPNFGLHMGELSRRIQDNTLAVVIHYSATLREALECLFRHSRLVRDHLTLRLERGPELATIRLELSDGEPIERHAAECSLVMLTILCRQSVGPGFNPVAVELTHPAPASIDEHRRLFGVEPVFGASHHQLIFASRWLDHPMPHADPSVCVELESKLALMMSRLGGPSLIERVRKGVAGELRGGLPSVDLIAEKLGMSGRSLQRRLQADGTSFQEVLNEARCEMACHYLASTGYPIMEIAFLLGFSELSSFHRAFKRWKGVTPGEFRAARGQGLAASS